MIPKLEGFRAWRCPSDPDAEDLLGAVAAATANTMGRIRSLA